MVTKRKYIFAFLLSSFIKLYGLTTCKGFTGPQKLELSPVLLTETSWDTSVTALKIKRTNSPEPLNSSPCQSVHWDLFASALIQAKHLWWKAVVKDQDTMKLGLSANVAIFNIALISDTKDDLPTEEMLIKLRISKPFSSKNNSYRFLFWPSSFYCSTLFSTFRNTIIHCALVTSFVKCNTF